MLRHRIRLTLLLVAAMVVATGAQQTTGAGARAYVDEVQAWRLKHEQDYSSQYVPLAGLFFLKPGANPAGSAASSVVRLPPRVPQQVGHDLPLQRVVLDEQSYEVRHPGLLGHGVNPETPIWFEMAPSQVFPQTLEERMPDLSLGRLRAIFDLG